MATIDEQLWDLTMTRHEIKDILKEAAKVLKNIVAATLNIGALATADKKIQKANADE